MRLTVYLSDILKSLFENKGFDTIFAASSMIGWFVVFSSASKQVCGFQTPTVRWVHSAVCHRLLSGWSLNTVSQSVACLNRRDNHIHKYWRLIIKVLSLVKKRNKNLLGCLVSINRDTEQALVSNQHGCSHKLVEKLLYQDEASNLVTKWGFFFSP